MKKLISAFMLILATASPLVCLGENSYEKDPAYLPIDKVLDLKAIRPEVNVNLPKFLLQDAIAELGTGTNGPLAGAGPELGELLKDVKLIRVIVIEANPTNRAALDSAMKTLREQLESKWTTIVSVPESNVGVYSIADATGESMAGIAVLVHDGDNAVIAHVLGRVSIGKLIKLASRMDKVPKDFLQKLQGLSAQTGATNAPKPAESYPQKPAEAPEEASKTPAQK
jgi:hypothetical protein